MLLVIKTISRFLDFYMKQFWVTASMCKTHEVVQFTCPLKYNAVMTKQMPSFCSRNEMCSSMWIELGKVLSSTPVLSCLSHKTSSQSISVTRFGLDKEECWQLFFPRFATKKGLIMRDTLALLKLYSSATLHDGFSLNDFPSDLFTCTHMRVEQLISLSRLDIKSITGNQKLENGEGGLVTNIEELGINCVLKLSKSVYRAIKKR